MEWFGSWKVCVRAGLAVMFLFTGVAHFTRTREDLIRMVPPFFSNARAIVTITGLAEFAGAGGLILSGLVRYAAYGLILLLLLMLPANVYAADQKLTIAGRPATPLVFRIPLQALWIGLLWWSAA